MRISAAVDVVNFTDNRLVSKHYVIRKPEFMHLKNAALM